LPEPKIYRATERAFQLHSTRPLAGNRRSAQRYADKITSSEWWAKYCPGFAVWEDPPPKRVWVWEDLSTEAGGSFPLEEVTVVRGEEYPGIILGHGEVHDGVKAIADKWVILHELAHVMTNLVVEEGHHGPNFCYMFIFLVEEFLGKGPATDLIRACKDFKIRMNYRLLSVGGGG
jgi:hypothetical protein